MTASRRLYVVCGWVFFVLLCKLHQCTADQLTHIYFRREIHVDSYGRSWVSINNWKFIIRILTNQLLMLIATSRLSDASTFGERNDVLGYFLLLISPESRTVKCWWIQRKILGSLITFQSGSPFKLMQYSSQDRRNWKCFFDFTDFAEKLLSSSLSLQLLLHL